MSCGSATRRTAPTPLGNGQLLTRGAIVPPIADLVISNRERELTKTRGLNPAVFFCLGALYSSNGPSAGLMTPGASRDVHWFLFFPLKCQVPQFILCLLLGGANREGFILLKGEARPMTERRRGKRTASFEERLALEALRLKEQAKQLPPGERRGTLLRRARQADIDAHINEWIASPGLQPAQPSC